MKRQTTASPIEVRALRGEQGNTQNEITPPALGPRGEHRRIAAQRATALRSVDAWTHTLVLKGELTHRSAHALELEIERLCAAGVTEIALDLRELAQLDSVGLAVIAFRSGLCKRRGCDFTVIAGSPALQRAFEKAGIAELLREEQSAEEIEPDALRSLVLAGD
jgi:anti-anti-sigma factor